MIDILIVNYNCVSRLQKLLEALVHTEASSSTRRTKYQITVVDNHSTDGSAAMVKAQFPAVQIIERPSNDGYSAAVNEGLAATHQSEILLLNSDVLLGPDAVAQLSRIWDRLDFPGIVAPLHLEEDEFPQLTWGRVPNRAIRSPPAALGPGAFQPGIVGQKSRIIGSLQNPEGGLGIRLMHVLFESRRVGNWSLGSEFLPLF